MKLNVRNFFLKSLPYLMSIAGGVILYTGAIDNAPNDNLRDLVINVSASLLSIPLVFLLYDYTNSRVTHQMRRHMANSMTDRLNSLMLNIVYTLRSALAIRGKLTTESLNRMLILRSAEISHRLKITPKILNDMRSLHNDLDTLLYHNGSANVLTGEQMQILTALSRDMTRLINENKFHRNSHLSSRFLESLMGHMLDWLDSDAIAALSLAQHISSLNTVDVQKNNKK